MLSGNSYNLFLHMAEASNVVRSYSACKTYYDYDDGGGGEE
jgi:hypothetical protein